MGEESGIDGLILTKFDAVDDKVGAALSSDRPLVKTVPADERPLVVDTGTLWALDVWLGVLALLIGGLGFGGALLLPAISGAATGYELAANLVNFGAFISFMGVNAAALMRYYIRAEKRELINLILPAVGFVVCLVLWWNLSIRALIFGIGWMAVGIAFAAWRTRGFTGKLAVFGLGQERDGAP